MPRRAGGRVVVVGLGPAGPELITLAARERLAAPGGGVWFRTFRHPAAEAVRQQIPGARSFDHLYESHSDFSHIYPAIAAALIDEAASGRSVTYAVPGSPLVAERSVVLLREAAERTEVGMEVIEGLSFSDLAWTRLGIDPVAEGVRLVDAENFRSKAAGEGGAMLVAQCWNQRVLSEVKLSVEEPTPRQRAVLLHHLGLGDEEVKEVAWADLDHSIEADHLTSVYVAGLGVPVAAELMSLASTVAELRRRCPWDAVQTHASLAEHLLEETYETMEAVEALGDHLPDASSHQVDHVVEELGDLLCQVYFHATLGAEEGLFNLADIARAVNHKLVDRHPHVFADAVASSPGEVLGNWERRKHEEKGRTHLFEGIPVQLPALARAAKFERKLSSVGLGERPSDAPGAKAGSPAPPEAVKRAGTVLLELARSFAADGIDPESALRRALDGLGTRVGELERRAGAKGRSLSEVAPEQLRAWYEELSGSAP
ncbi:MAG: MazG nucleotide pyrophosphohydrolase domain-containing protein [Acidimicrobiales bacterium]